MTILFINDVCPTPTAGGIERVTCSLKVQFERCGHRCAVAYVQAPAESTALPTPWEWEEQLACESIGKIFERKVDVVLSSLANHRAVRTFLPLVYEAACSRGIKVVSAFHMMPGFEAARVNWEYIVYSLLHRQNVRRALFDAAVRVAPRWFIHRLLRPKYRIIPSHSDAVVLLTEGQIDLYKHIAGSMDREPIYTSISNMLSFPEVSAAKRSKQVLLVARLDERHKSIVRALRVWAEFERAEPQTEWQLVIAGDGPDRGMLHRKARELGLKRATFLGARSDMAALYAESAILIITSSTEGFSLALVEGMQCGCVPIVYNSFAAASDIIRGDAGVLVADGDARAFVRALRKLVSDDALRALSAQSAQRRAADFAPDAIVEQWLALFNNLITKE